MAQLGWHLIRAFSSLGVGAYYRAFRVENADRIPKTGPVLFVVNHPNGLVDGGVVLRAVPRPVAIGVRGRLLHVPVLGGFIQKFGLLPVDRPPQKGPRDRLEQELFAPFRARFGKDGAVVFFPEGTSHHEPQLKKLRSGAARLALDAEAAEDFDLGLQVVPIGLHFEPASQFRGEVHVRVGEPFSIRDLKPVARPKAIHAIQERIRAGLRPLMLHIEDARLEPLVRGIAEVYDEDQRSQHGAYHPRPRAEVIQIAGACLNHFLVTDPAAVRVAKEKLDWVQRLTRQTGLDAEAVQSHQHPVRGWFTFLGLLLQLVVGFPFFLFGALTSYLPYRATDALARQTATGNGPVPLPTLRILWGTLFFGLFWGALLALVADWSESIGITLFFLALLVVCAFYARFYAERVETWRSRMAGLRPLVRPGIGRVTAAREELLRYVNGLVGRYAEATDTPLIPPRRVKWTTRVPWRKVAATSLIALLVWFAWGFFDHEVQELQGRPSPWNALAKEKAHAMLASDAAALESVFESLDTLHARMQILKAGFDAEEREYVDEDDARDIRQALLTYLNCRATLFRMAWFYRTPERDGDGQATKRAFLLSYAAALELCRRGMQMVEVFRGKTKAILKLNEGDVAFGLPPDTFDRVRSNLASRAVFDELAAATARFSTLDQEQTTAKDTRWERLWARAETGQGIVGRLADARSRYKWEAAVARAKRSLADGRYELSKFIALRIGEVRIRSGELAHGLISQAQVDWLQETQLEPGDILLERRNWALSNVFLPGFWTHAALYIGGVDGLEDLGILDDEGVKPHLAALAQTDRRGNPKVVLEALGAGVVLNTLEYSVGEADAVCVLRPRVPREQIAEAMARAMRHHGKPYDFDFDFFSADRLVCTELVYKAYQGSMEFELQEIMGRQTLPALQILRKWADERRTPEAQLEFICFLDAVEDEGVAREGDEAQLIETLSRPGMTVLQAHGDGARGPRVLLIVLTGLLLLGLLLFKRRA